MRMNDCIYARFEVSTQSHIIVHVDSICFVVGLVIAASVTNVIQAAVKTIIVCYAGKNMVESLTLKL